MRWWSKDAKNWEGWVEGGIVDPVNSGAVLECCYAACNSCQAALFSVIRFLNVTPVEVLEFGVESAWPQGFPK